MISIKYKGTKYIIGDYILENAPIYSKSCRNTRELISKRNITEYIYAKKRNNKWTISDGQSIKLDKVFISENIYLTIPELNDDQGNIEDLNGIEKAPDIIKLTDDEKFKDDQNNIVEIETRGIREHDKIYFKVKDVMIDFGLPNLNTTILHPDTSYKFNVHYKYFICNDFYALKSKTNKKNNGMTSEMFLTYKGILKVLFLSHSGRADKFVDWVTKTVFVVQMGSNEQRNQLVSNIKGVSYNTIQELFNINARSLPCVYLTAFNTVGILREKMNIDPFIPCDWIIYKYGLTKSFSTRKNGHKAEYKTIADLIEMKLVYYTYIDPIYLSEAEKEIKISLEHYKIKYENHDELVAISPNSLKDVKKIYELIGLKYSGHTEEFNREIIKLNNKIENLMTQIENKDKETKLLLENSNLSTENKLLIKDLKIKELEMQLMTRVK